ncbi:xanthomonalisin [Dyella marensis]|uniref:Xanthomonalisin n=2 Tax=Rhodanobacteraceae TaxID=1775411 RepID=A0A1I1Z7Y1_9GAMM|nr:xanthomonalisin [Dyella marensis]
MMPMTLHSMGSVGRHALLPCLMLMSAWPAHAGEVWVDTHTQGVSLLQQATRQALPLSAVQPLDVGQQLHITVALQWRQPDRLQTFLREVKRRDSAVFRRYLSPAEFKSRYAPTDAQVDAVVAYLRQHGFDGIEVSPNNLLISARGHGANVETAFHTRMLQLDRDGRRAYANETPAQVPAALGGIVGSVLGLQELPSAPGPKQVPVLKRAATPAPLRPEGPYHPEDLPPIYHVGDTPTAQATTVGIVTGGDPTQIVRDLNSYTTGAGLPAVSTRAVSVTDKGGPGYPTQYAPPDQVQLFTIETDVTAQVIASVSGSVKQMVIYAAGAGDSVAEATVVATYNQAVVEDAAEVIATVFHQDELRAYQSGAQAADDAIFQQAVAQGQTFVVPAGDNGVYEREYGVYWTVPSVSYSVAEPATSPYVVAVGGTQLFNSGGTTWSAEKVWNNYAYEVVRSNTLRATGGGESLFEPAPPWQVATLGAQTAHRQVPDIAFLAGGQYPIADTVGSGGILPIFMGLDFLWEGNATSSAIFAAVWARIESAHQNSLGLPTQEMYENFASTMPGSPLHDIAGGYNGLTRNANYGGIGYHCDFGWDHCSGWGSLDIARFNAYVTKYWNANPGYYVNTDAHPVTTSGCYCTSDSINIHNRSANAAALPVAVNAHVTYPKRGDLRITLVMSDGTKKVLKQPDPNDTAADIDATWPVDIPVHAVDGSWRLVVDNVTHNGSAGTLVSWGMKF